jgi:hypothetical protein
MAELATVREVQSAFIDLQIDLLKVKLRLEALGKNYWGMPQLEHNVRLMDDWIKNEIANDLRCSNTPTSVR